MFTGFPARRWIGSLFLLAFFGMASSAWGQPADELIQKLLDLSKQKKLTPKKDDDDLRRLRVQRFNVALEELQEQCKDFKNHLATKASVFATARHLLEADLDLQARPADRVKVLEKSLELVRWYEKRLEKGHEDKLVPRVDLLRTRYERLTLEIELVKAQRDARSRVSK